VGLCDKGLVFCLQEYVQDIEANEMLELSIFWVCKRNVVKSREGVELLGLASRTLLGCGTMT